MSLVIIAIIFIFLIFKFSYSTSDKRGFLNIFGLDLSQEEIEKSKERELYHNAKLLINEAKDRLKYSDWFKEMNKKEQTKAIYDEIESTCCYGQCNCPTIANKALEILDEELKHLK